MAEAVAELSEVARSKMRRCDTFRVLNTGGQMDGDREIDT